MTLEEIKALEPATQEGVELRDQMVKAVQLLAANGYPGDDFAFAMTPRLRELIDGLA